MWKNKIKSGITFAIATHSWYQLVVMETRLVPFLCSILLVLMLLLFIWVKFGEPLFIWYLPLIHTLSSSFFCNIGDPDLALIRTNNTISLIIYIYAMVYNYIYGMVSQIGELPLLKNSNKKILQLEPYFQRSKVFS